MNRQPGPLQQLSSMRAATDAGLTFIGAHQPGQLTGQADECSFKPRIIAPSGEMAEQRASIAEAIARNTAFWKEELEQWASEFGEGAVEKLRETIASG